MMPSLLSLFNGSSEEFEVKNSAYVDKCEMRLSPGASRVEVFIKDKIVLTDINTNHKYDYKDIWLGIVDVGSKWTEFEIYDPKRPECRKYLGDKHSIDTSNTYANLQLQLK